MKHHFTFDRSVKGSEPASASQPVSFGPPVPALS